MCCILCARQARGGLRVSGRLICRMCERALVRGGAATLYTRGDLRLMLWLYRPLRAFDTE